MEDKKTYSLSISKTNSDGSTSNINLNTPYSDEVMALLRLSGVPNQGPEIDSMASNKLDTGTEVVAVAEPEIKHEVEFGEDYANEPDEMTASQQTNSEFALKRNLQRLNSRGKDGGDNRLGESAEKSKIALMTTEKLQKVWNKYKDDTDLGEAFASYLRNVRKELLKRKKSNIKESIDTNKLETKYNNYKNDYIEIFEMDQFNEVMRKPVHTDEDIAEFNNDIIKTLKMYFKGKAWFKGGSYSYLMDVRKPNIMMASDGGKIGIKSFAQGIKDYADSGIYGDMFDDHEYFLDPANLKEYFRPFHAVRGQEDHELANMRGD